MVNKRKRSIKKLIGLSLVSIILFAISIEGILSFPGLLKSSQTTLEYMVIISQALYGITGILIIVGLWFSFRFTSAVVIFWGIVSLGAALGGPAVFSHVKPTFPRTAMIITLIIIIITAGLFFYSKYIIRKEEIPS